MKSASELKLIPTLEEWKKNTDAGLFIPRGDKLQAIDALIKRYETATTKSARKKTLSEMCTALDAYQGGHVGWRNEPRNKKGAVSDLHDSLEAWRSLVMPNIPNPRASDVAYGRSGFMESDHIQSRLGIIWLFSRTSIVGVDPEPEAVKKVVLKDADERIWYQKIWDALVNFCKSIQDSIRKLVEKGSTVANWKSIKGYPRKGFDLAADYVRENIDSMNTSGLPTSIVFLLENLMSFIFGSIVDSLQAVAMGVIEVVTAATARYQAWDAEKHVDISAGTPATIVEAIKNAMSRNIGEGLATVLKGGLVFIPNFSSIAFTIANALETIYKKLVKLWQTARLKAFFADAKQLWDERERPEPFHARAQDFNAWFKSYVSDVPAIAMLALNSGCCGSKMVWLNLFNSTGVPTTAGQFDKGVKFLDEHLMSYGSKFLSEYAIKFESKDDVANSLITNASKYSVIAPQATAIRVIKCIVGRDEGKIIQRVFPDELMHDFVLVE